MRDELETTKDVTAEVTTTDEVAASGAAPLRDSPVGFRRLGLEASGVAVAAWVWVAWLFRVWRMPLRLPFDSRSDATLISMMTKTIGERGWYYNQPRLGAPFGQQFYDFPHGGESIQLFGMKVLTWLTGDWGLAMNLYFLAGTGFLAAVTFLVLRHLRFGPVVSGVAALIYTFMPYHFAHGQMHLWRSTYFTAPLAVLLLVWATSWRERFLIEPAKIGPGSLRSNLRVRRVLFAVAVAMVVAGSETMTTAFTMTLLAAGAVVGAIRWREPQRLLVSGALVLVMAGTFAVFSAPTLNFYRVHGSNDLAASRVVTESEWYGLKLSRLVTPEPGHRSDFLSDVGSKAQERSIVPSERGQALGLLGTAGFLGAIYGAIAGRRRRIEDLDVAPGWDRAALRDHAGVFTLLALLFGTIGGMSVLLAMAGFAQVRVWDRILLIIAFFAMTTVLIWSENFAAWVRTRQPQRYRPILGAVAVAVLAFGLWDGTPPVRTPTAQVEARHASDRAFVADIEAQMPDGTAIFQLPVLAFPEVKAPGQMVDYDPLRGFLADSGTLRWSYGSVKGRPSGDWQTHLRDYVGPVAGLPGLLGLGFTGLWVDTYGYTDDGAEIAQIADVVGGKPLTSPDGRFLFFDLRPYKARLGMSDEQLQEETRTVLQVEPPAAPA
ncbi:MAG: hypothetical protein ABI239_09905 [Aquihabitans sp.]